MLILAAHGPLNWFLRGARSAGAMVWMTFWPLVFGFALSGAIQSFVRRDGLRESLGSRSVLRASFLGIISSSCSYAASAMARSLFAKGASWTNSLIFMIASTNLVIELGVVLYVLLGWQFLVAELVGGAIMIAIISLVLPRIFSTAAQVALRARVEGETSTNPSATSEVPSVRSLDGWSRAARFAWGDLTMLRKELLIGFVVAGYLAADVPTSWWRTFFVSGHGTWTIIENALVAPLIAVISFVCSVGNIPLAAALWARGVAFGGVVAFIFADLITFPLLVIYRKFYGTAAALRILVSFWGAMSLAGLLVNLIFRGLHAVPRVSKSPTTTGQFDLGATLILNTAALVVLIVAVWLVRRRVDDDASAIDPICGMQVLRATAAAVVVHDGITHYFCSPRCAERFSATPTRSRGADRAAMLEDPDGDVVDPVCQMRVSSHNPPASATVDGVRWFFCGDSCRDAYVSGTSVASTPVRLSRKPHE